MGLRSYNKQSRSGHLSVTQDVNHTSAGRALRWFLCTEQGHVKRNCLQRSMQKRVGHCFRCNQMSHLMGDCAIIQQTEPQMTTKTQQQYILHRLGNTKGSKMSVIRIHMSEDSIDKLHIDPVSFADHC